MLPLTKHPLGEFQHLAHSLEKTLEAIQGGPTRGPDVGDLAAIIEAWPILSDDSKARILAIVQVARDAAGLTNDHIS